MSDNTNGNEKKRYIVISEEKRERPAEKTPIEIRVLQEDGTSIPLEEANRRNREKLQRPTPSEGTFVKVVERERPVTEPKRYIVVQEKGERPTTEPKRYIVVQEKSEETA